MACFGFSPAFPFRLHIEQLAGGGPRRQGEELNDLPPQRARPDYGIFGAKTSPHLRHVGPRAHAALAGHRELIPLAWTVNGGTPVVASLLAIPIAMAWGFSTVLMIAVACYVAACLAITLWWSRSRSTSRVPASR